MPHKNSRGEEEQNAHLSRRNVLASMSSMAAATGMATTASAENDANKNNPEVQENSCRIVQAKLSADVQEPIEGDLIQQTSCSMVPSYYIGGNRAFIVSSKMNALTESSTHVTTPSEIIGTEGSATVELPPLLRSDYTGLTKTTFETVEGTQKYNFEFSIEDGGTIIKMNDENLMSLRVGQNKTMKVGRVKARTRLYERYEVDNPHDAGDETLTRKKKVGEGEANVTQKITVRDLGRVPLLSTSQRYVFPETMPGANQLIKMVQKSTDDSITRSESNKSRSMSRTKSGIVTVQEVKN